MDTYIHLFTQTLFTKQITGLFDEPGSNISCHTTESIFVTNRQICKEFSKHKRLEQNINRVGVECSALVGDGGLGGVVYDSVRRGLVTLLRAPVHLCWVIPACRKLLYRLPLLLQHCCKTRTIIVRYRTRDNNLLFCSRNEVGGIDCHQLMSLFHKLSHQQHKKFLATDLILNVLKLLNQTKGKSKHICLTSGNVN